MAFTAVHDACVLYPVLMHLIDLDRGAVEAVIEARQQEGPTDDV